MVGPLPAADIAVRAQRVVFGGREQALTLSVIDGRIVGISAHHDRVRSDRLVEFGADVVVLPGLVDTHVHVCQPGHTDWEGFASATAAAAAGGITTIADMPIDSVPATVDVDSLTAKRAAARPSVRIDTAFWGGLTADNLDDIEPLWDAGVVGFKCFLADSGAADFPPIRPEDLPDVMALTARLGAPLMVHAELLDDAPPVRGGARYSNWLEARPEFTEDRAVLAVIEGARRTGGSAHVAHLSSAGSLAALAAARSEGVAVTAETCPHYLSLCAEDIRDGDTTAKCSPPIRGDANRGRLWEALSGGVLTAVVSDHSPCAPAMKSLDSGDFSTAWGGVASLELSLAVVWTEAANRRVPSATVASWMATAPADLAGLTAKGRIEVGADADLCVLAPDEEFVVDPERLRQRHDLTPYAGRRLRGVVRRTMLRGEWVDRDGPAMGRLVERG